MNRHLITAHQNGTVRRHGWLLAPRLVILALGALLPPLLPLAHPVADAEVAAYSPRTKDYPLVSGGTTPLTIRGRIDDNCLFQSGIWCMAISNPETFRPEATAQAAAIRELAALLGDTPVVMGTGYTKVDWEVGPIATTAPPTDPTYNPANYACVPNAPGAVSNQDNWRSDIIVESRSILEVKHVSDRGMVENQIQCYRDAAGRRGIRLEKNGTLNAMNWVRALYPANVDLGVYPDSEVICAWGQPSLNGHVYFAKYFEVPDLTIRNMCRQNPRPANDPTPANDLIRELLEKLAIAAAASAAGYGAGRYGGRGGITPAPRTAYRVVNPGVATTFDISILQMPDRPRTLEVYWGDGSSSSAVVDAGTGAQTLQFVKSFSNSGTNVRRLVPRMSALSGSTSPIPPLLMGQSRSAAATTTVDTYADLVVDVNPDSVPPSTPTNLHFADIHDYDASHYSITLEWSPSTDDTEIAGYKIYRGGGYLATAETTTFTDITLQSQPYYEGHTIVEYTVSAIDLTENESSQSSPAILDFCDAAC